MRPTVIGIAAPAGAGKTTITRLFSTQLAEAPTVHFDDYAAELPADWTAWLRAGADFNDWRAN